MFKNAANKLLSLNNQILTKEVFLTFATVLKPIEYMAKEDMEVEINKLSSETTKALKEFKIIETELVNFHDWIGIMVNVAETHFDAKLTLKPNFKTEDCLGEKYHGSSDTDYENLMP